MGDALKITGPAASHRGGGLKTLREAGKAYKRAKTPAFIQVPVSKAEKGQVQASLGRAEKGLKEDNEKGLLNKRTLKAALPGAGIGALFSANVKGAEISRKTPVKEAITKLLKHGKKGIIGGAAVGAGTSAAVQLRERAHKKKLIRLMKEELVKRKKKSS